MLCSEAPGKGSRKLNPRWSQYCTLQDEKALRINDLRQIAMRTLSRDSIVQHVEVPSLDHPHRREQQAGVRRMGCGKEARNAPPKLAEAKLILR